MWMLNCMLLAKTLKEILLTLCTFWEEVVVICDPPRKKKWNLPYIISYASSLLLGASWNSPSG